MKVTSLFLALLPLSAAVPFTAPLGGRKITDPERLAQLELQHADALEKLRSGNIVPVAPNGFKDIEFDGNQKRIFTILGLGGMAIIEAAAAGTDLLATLGSRLHDVFTQTDYTIWHNTGYCRTYFQTHAGGEEYIKTYARGSSSATTVNERNVGWNDPENTDPPVLWFENEGAVGVYSVQFTATDKVAWGGIEGTSKCHFEGLCYPQYIFYRTGYNIILNTWQSKGDSTSCWYSSGEDCKGLCDYAVQDQFSKNGVTWGGDCAIPCLGDEGDGYTTVPKENAKIMVAGDSISHGMEDDWTWRWRLYSWLTENGYQTEFVGPWSGTHGRSPLTASQPRAPLFPGEAEPAKEEVTGIYANSVEDSFTSSGHASFWGRQAAQTRETIHDWVAQYQPDYLLLLLGFNDLGWFVSGPDGLIGNMGDLVQHAREAKPDLKILVGNVVDRLAIDGRQDLIDNTATYNRQLRDKIPNWFRYESPIAYVDVNANYDCRPASCPDGYDGLHPNARGEYRIAQAFAQSLKRDFGFTGKDFTVPDTIPTRDVGTPRNVETLAKPEGLFTTWDNVKFSRGYDIRSRIKGMTDWWSEGMVYPSTRGSWSTWILDGQTWEYQVRAKGDGDVTSDWSPFSSNTAKLSTSPGPSNIRSYPSGSNSIDISWDPVSGYDVNRYSVIVWDRDTEGAFINMQAASGTSYTVTGLISGHRYGTWVATNVNMIGSLSGQPEAPGGLPLSGREVIVGAGSPAKPTQLVVSNTDATTVSLSWQSASNAVGYSIWVRSVRDNTEFHIDGSTTETTWSVSFLFPGTWNYEFCVAAYNGNLETDHSVCVIPPVCCGFEAKRDEIAINSTDVITTNDTVDDSQSMIDDATLRLLYAMWSQQNTTGSFMG